MPTIPSDVFFNPFSALIALVGLALWYQYTKINKLEAKLDKAQQENLLLRDLLTKAVVAIQKVSDPSTSNADASTMAQEILVELSKLSTLSQP